MRERVRVFALMCIMAIGSLSIAGSSIWILYRAAFDQESERLKETVQSQARLIEAVARFDRVQSTDYPGGWEAATLQQIIDAHREYEAFGRTGEFVIGRREGDSMVFLLRHRHGEMELPEPVPFDSELAEPMRRALRGESGTVVGLDYRGVEALAAYEPVSILGVGIVAKIDLAEIRAPFQRAAAAATGIALLAVGVVAVLFFRVSHPLVAALEERSRNLEELVAALKESEERYRATFDSAAVGIAHFSLDGRILRANPEFRHILGYASDEVLELTLHEITGSSDVEATLESARRLLEGEVEAVSIETRFVRRDSSLVWVDLTLSLIRDEAREPRHLVAIVENAAERKRAELAVKSSLAEKEVLLREIHHRVKNNMQVISSLLSLRARSIEDASLRRLLEESHTRVRAMALIHEILYESEDLSRIELGAYVSKLATHLVQMYGTDPGRIALVVHSGGVTLGIDDTVPCGLVINELLSNSLKYAFDDGRPGEIRIEAVAPKDDEIVLAVCDDGVGIPAEVDIRNTQTMGMRLVVGLVEKQLGGRVQVDRSQGTCFKITFAPASARVAR